MTKYCKDCVAEWDRRSDVPAALWRPRPAPHPGPRCASHDRQKRRLAKAGAHERRVQKEYGLKPGEYGILYLFQGQVCAICTRASGASRKLSVDHDHKTGLVRGLLCRPCNDILGQLRDDPEALRRAAAYLVSPPAQQLGIVAVHRENREVGGDGGTD